MSTPQMARVVVSAPPPGYQSTEADMYQHHHREQARGIQFTIVALLILYLVGFAPFILVRGAENNALMPLQHGGDEHDDDLEAGTDVGDAPEADGESAGAIRERRARDMFLFHILNGHQAVLSTGGGSNSTGADGTEGDDDESTPLRTAQDSSGPEGTEQQRTRQQSRWVVARRYPGGRLGSTPQLIYQAMQPEDLALMRLAMQMGAAQARESAREVPPLSDEELARLPIAAFSGAYKKGAVPEPEGPAEAAPGTAQGAVADSAAAAVGPSHAETHSCSVCLEDFADGEQVMTLPCLHRFHADCVTPWLRQQGAGAQCPMCKTPVFQ